VTGTILVESPAVAVGAAVAYCRVSSADLERQVGRVAEECGTRGITLAATITEIGSGVNGNRATLRKLLADPGVSTIVVEHCDRLARFGVDHLEAALVGEVTGCSGGELRRDSPMETHVRPAPCGQRVLPREKTPRVTARTARRGLRTQFHMSSNGSATVTPPLLCSLLLDRITGVEQQTISEQRRSAPVGPTQRWSRRDFRARRRNDPAQRCGNR
jgi:hypothetical protein